MNVTELLVTYTNVVGYFFLLTLYSRRLTCYLNYMSQYVFPSVILQHKQCGKCVNLICFLCFFDHATCLKMSLLAEVVHFFIYYPYMDMCGKGEIQ